jgi:phenylacetate-CoA ligase
MNETSPKDPAKPTPAQAYLIHLRRLERLPLQDFVFTQARILERLVRHAREHAPFYKERLKPAFDGDDILDLSRWHDVPVLQRAEAEANAKCLKSATIPAHAGIEVPDRTSGTGGSPFHFSRSMAAMVADGANSLRVFLDHGFDVDARFADIRIDVDGDAQYPEGETRSDWSHGAGSGDYVLLDIDTPLDKQVEWLLRRRPKILFTWASHLRRIARRLEESGQTLDLATVGTSADKCTEAVKADCRRVFGCEPVDVLGVRELGLVAFPCNRAPVFHLAAESALIEVITDDGRPARPGETGRIVGTGLYNYHMPFIRYGTGDYVTLADQPCVCGRSLPAVSAILGRARNRYLKRDGSLVFPDVPESLLDEALGAMAWQLVQTAPAALDLRCEEADASRIERAMPQIAEAISRGFGEELRINTVCAPPRADTPRKKREMFLSELDRALL